MLLATRPASDPTASPCLRATQPLTTTNHHHERPSSARFLAYAAFCNFTCGGSMKHQSPELGCTGTYQVMDLYLESLSIAHRKREELLAKLQVEELKELR